MGEPERIGKHRKNPSSTEEYVAWVARLIDGLCDRISQDPAVIVFGPDLQERLMHALNIGLVQAQDRKQVTGEGYSLRQLAALAGVSHVALLDRMKRGRAELARREEITGVTRLGQAAKPSVPAIREQRAEAIAHAGVPDLRELRTA